MLQGHGMILKGRMQIRLGEMPRIPGLGEQAEVREGEFSNQSAFLLQCLLVIFKIEPWLNEQEKAKE